MALVDPKKKNNEKFNPNVDNSSIAANANQGGRIVTYVSFILIIPMILYIVKRNSLVRLQMKINEHASGIDVQLKKRKDTLVKLIDAVKGSMKFEKDVQKSITELRTGRIKDTQKVMELTDKVNSAFNVSVENYPELKSTKNVENLMSTATDIELELAAARRLYNSTVNQFNTGIFTWPGSVAASAMKLTKLPLFSAAAEDKEDVTVKF